MFCSIRKLYILLFFLLFTSLLKAQKHHIMLGTDIPLQYAVGYEYKPVKWVGFQAKGGLLLPPYSQAILGILDLFGVESGIINMIDGAFEFGRVGQFSINFHTSKWYTSVYAQYFDLRASDVPQNLIENYYGYDFSPINLPSVGLLNINRKRVQVTMQSELLQAGLGFGRKITIAKIIELRLELMLGKNIWNKTELDVSSVKGTVYGLLLNEDDLKNQIETDLSESYKKYAYTPSFNVYWVFRF
jgi:hypothetical protein